uniref:Uncharacterized protein n=1 Tax=Amphimedon queenslandica TaxID=400682 RepID=A0A1X7UKE9_AMPQE
MYFICVPIYAREAKRLLLNKRLLEYLKVLYSKRSTETANESDTARVSQSVVQENNERSKETDNESETARVSQSVVQEN